jgi:hypothetical protein
MGWGELPEKVKTTVKNEILIPLKAPYQPPEYEEIWGGNKDKIFNPIFTQIRAWRDRRKFRNELRETDTFIVGHPKSGNTWTAYMIAMLLYEDNNYEINMANIGEYIPVVHGADSSIAKYKKLSSPRVFRNEWPVYPNRYPKTIYLIRDPRSIIVSYFHMYNTLFKDKSCQMDEFIDEYLAYGFIRHWEPLLRWDKQIIRWLKKSKQDDNILIIKYEDMVADRSVMLEKIADFLQLAYSEEIFNMAVERGSFSSMKNNEKKYGAESYINMVGKKGEFVRSGTTDGWKKSLTLVNIKKIEHVLGPAMKAVGYL